MKKPFVTTLLQKLAPELGFKLLVEPQWQQLGEIEFANGRKHFFLKTDLGINNSASAAIAKDKAYTKFLLKNVGIGVAEGRAFSSDRLNKRAGIDNGLNSGMRYAAELEYPLYVKPNDLDYGELVVKVYSWNELRSVALYIFERTDTLLIEKAVSGRDFRVLVYNGRVVAAYERIPLSVIGDGKSSVRDLGEAKIALLKEKGRLRRDFDVDDLTVYKVLNRSGFDKADIPAEGARVNLLESASLSTGGEAIDLSDAIHPEFAELAIKACGAVGLKFAGVDFLAADLTKSPKEQNYAVLELNSTPALGMFYELGPKQHQQVEDVYKEIILDIMSEKCG